MFQRMLCNWLLLFQAIVQLSLGYYTPRKEVGERLSREFSRFDRRHPTEFGLGYYYQGDIILKPPEAGRVAIRDKAEWWPNATVPYLFAPGFTLVEKAVVLDAMLKYRLSTCVKFVPRTTEQYYITIWKNDTGCHSYVGFHADNQFHQVNLQSPQCLTQTGTPVHELLHSLGAFHEFTRPDRDDWITINRSALLPQYQSDEFFNANFGKLPEAEVNMFNITYNYHSVMHYSKWAGAASVAYPVMINKKPCLGDFGNPLSMALTDVDMVNIMYCGKVQSG